MTSRAKHSKIHTDVQLLLFSLLSTCKMGTNPFLPSNFLGLLCLHGVQERTYWPVSLSRQSLYTATLCRETDLLQSASVLGASGWMCFPLFLGGRNCRNQWNGQWSCRTEDEFQRVQSCSFPDIRPQSQERCSGPDCCYPPSQNPGDPLSPDGGLLTPQARVGDTQQESLQQVQCMCNTGRAAQGSAQDGTQPSPAFSQLPETSQAPAAVGVGLQGWTPHVGSCSLNVFGTKSCVSHIC